MSARSAVAVAAVVLSACATAPRDSGLGDVRRMVREQTQQDVAWDPAQVVAAPNDAAVAARLREPLTADRAVQVAFANNRDLQATLDELGVARAGLLAATTIRNPVFHIEARFPGDPTTPIEFGLVQTLVDLLSRGSRRARGIAEFEIARDRVSAAVVNFAGEVRTNYFALLAARRVAAGHATIVAAQAAATELAQRQHAAGNLDDLDLETEQARYETVKLEQARAQLALVLAREQVVRDLGLLGPVELVLPDDFPALPETEMTQEQLEQQVLAQRLDVRIARGEVESAARAAGVARTQVLDELTLGLHFEREPDGKQTMGPELEFPIPLFDRGSPARQGARARLRQAQQRHAALAVNVRSLARAALESLLAARARVVYLREVVVPRRERILQLTLTRYNAMLLGPFDLLKARQDLAGAERDLVVATLDYWRARTSLRTTLAGVSTFTVARQGGAPAGADLDTPATRPETKEH